MLTTFIRVGYEQVVPGQALEDDVLLAIEYSSTPSIDDQRCLLVPLAPLADCASREVWRGSRPVKRSTHGRLCYAEDGDHIAGCLTIAEERCSDGLAALTERAYRDILRFQRESNYQHIWRMWNFVSDINTGIGDTERYRQFCLGRAQAFAAFSTDPLTSGFPAASTVGKRDSPRTLQVCWIASRHRASVVENPRQVSAFDYPRQYGPASPSFSRATVSPERLLLVSGTASIVGHESKHQGDLAAQIDETFRNLDALASDATDKRLIDALPFGRTTLVKAYLKDAGAASWVKDEIKRRLGPDGSPMILAADICRSELLIEIELVHQG